MKLKKRLTLFGLPLFLLLVLIVLIPSDADPLPIAFIYYDPGGTVSLDTLSVDGRQRATLVHSSPTNPLLDALVRRLPTSLAASLLPVQLADMMRTPVWIGEPPLLAYHSREIGTYCERVQRLEPANGKPAEIACLPTGLNVGSFAWSPDGSVFAFAERDAGGTRLEIYTAENEILERISLPSSIWGLAWSPDSKYLAVNMVHELGMRIFSIDGSSFILDTQDYSRGIPAWSPDSRSIAFQCFTQEIDQMDICSIDLDGSNYQRAAFDAAFPYIKKDLAWSPLGHQLVFAATQGLEFNDIYVVNPDGEGLLQLTSHPASDSEPAWSPDGSTLVFSSYRDGNWELYTVKADGSGLTRLTNTTGDEREPAWGMVGINSKEKKNDE